MYDEDLQEILVGLHEDLTDLFERTTYVGEREYKMYLSAQMSALATALMLIDYSFSV